MPDTGGGAFGAAWLGHIVAGGPEVSEAAPALLGALREDAELLDDIVADAMRQREISAWRPNREVFAALEMIANATHRSIQEVLDEAAGLLIEQWNKR